jgi:hypothetical protein
LEPFWQVARKEKEDEKGREGKVKDLGSMVMGHEEGLADKENTSN